MNEIEVRFYQYAINGNHTLIGVSTLTVAETGEKREFKIKNKGEDKGVLVFHEVKRSVRHEFGDFIENGLQLALVTCIDFTASNGSYDVPGSLHYSTHSKKSLYE